VPVWQAQGTEFNPSTTKKPNCNWDKMNLGIESMGINGLCGDRIKGESGSRVTSIWLSLYDSQEGMEGRHWPSVSSPFA
jgi:hypothetical protein